MKEILDVLLVEPYYGGSHRQWADGFKKHSKHRVELLTLPARNWKWRMHGAAVTCASKVQEWKRKPDVILTTDMLDVALFRGLMPDLSHIPLSVYFHENQLTYPWSEDDTDIKVGRDNHYGFINYTSALTADSVLFNSEYHKTVFLDTLKPFLQKFPDHQNFASIEEIERKSKVLHLGMDLQEFDKLKPKALSKPTRATILWNHRWEYDKNPEQFFEALFEIQDRGWEFNLVVLGEQFKNSPKIFEDARERLKDRIIHWGFVDDRREYAKWLWFSDILPVTSNQDFFGGSIVEAMYCNVKPLLPKRLAYPEHIPSSLQHVFFYEEAELVNRLQSWIKDISVLRKQQTRTFVEKYDWSALVGSYDEALSELINSSNH